MFREALSQFTHTQLVVFALLLFFVTFVGIVLWTFRRSGRKHYDEMASLPLDEVNHEQD